jgi:hypothetical protein
VNEVGAISASVNDDDYGTQKGGERIEFIINSLQCYWMLLLFL